MRVEAALKELESFLPGLNYVVSFDLHRVPTVYQGTPEDYVSNAIGPQAIIGGTSHTMIGDMLSEVEQCIRWEGDEGSHPDQTAIRSPRLDELVDCVLTYLELVATNSVIIWSFWLKDGHPHYPVQWDFAFVLVGPQSAEVFIGSGSD